MDNPLKNHEFAYGSPEDQEVVRKCASGEIAGTYPVELSLTHEEMALLGLAIAEMSYGAPSPIQHVYATIMFKATWSSHGLDVAKSVWHVSSPPGTPYPIDPAPRMSG